MTTILDSDDPAKTEESHLSVYYSVRLRGLLNQESAPGPLICYMKLFAR